MKSTTDRKKAFETIDKDNSGVVEFKEWYKHFDSLIRSTNMTAEELEIMYKTYEGDSKGINYGEYTSFMNDAFGKAEDFDIRPFVEESINKYAEMIVNHKNRADDLALGQLQFYIAFRRVILGNGTTQDLGMMDAINDVLQEKGILKKGVTFFK